MNCGISVAGLAVGSTGVTIEGAVVVTITGVGRVVAEVVDVPDVVAAELVCLVDGHAVDVGVANRLS